MPNPRLVYPIFTFVFLFLFYQFLPHGGAVQKTASGPSYRLFNSSSPLPSSRYAIATFLTGQSADPNYFTAARILAYQLLHANGTRLDLASSISFLVLCSSSVPEEQKVLLTDEGTTVVEVDDVKLPWWVKTGVTRWKEQFTKLRIFEMTQYERVLFIDADTLVAQPLDAIFHEPEVKSLAPRLDRAKQQRRDEAALPASWFFAARSDNALTGERAHPIPPLQTPNFSAGFWIAAPDKLLFAHMMSVMQHWRRFDPHTMEQSLLNYVFRREGCMPWRELDWRWSATWPGERDLNAGVRTLHEKFWKVGGTEVEELKRRWVKERERMGRFYRGAGEDGE
ncbi:nucleotide-diphospho-sugar transferase [Massariosphaeria phaeospora]|uniref:Nucleotide-diphospho-sugar transferase n=1 Tax=Massariosphaeria phaeospora TaxID=100035 RepID=A0A7C8IDR8_9PLEO|nr:nucleotide-diphospho-sugar transferase [Massariosphaeria phaeospora]